MIKIFKDVLRRHTPMMALYITLGLFSAYLSAWSASLMQSILDQFTSKTLHLSLILLYGGVMVGLCLINYAMNLPESRLRNGLYLDFKLQALKKMRTVHYTSYAQLGTGMLVQRIEAGASAGANAVFGFWLNLLSTLLPEVLCSLAFIALIDVRVMLWLGAGYILVFLVSNLLLRTLYRIKERILIDEEAFTGRLVRGIMELVVFRVHRRYGKEIEWAQGTRDGVVKDKTKMLLVHECFFTVFAVLVSLIKLGFLFYAYFAGQLTVGQFVALTALVDKAYQPIAIFNVIYVQYKLDMLAVKRYAEVLSLPDEPRMTTGNPIAVSKGEITLQSISCRYNEYEVLHNISLHIPAGSVIGLAGQSGSGKSTLVRLIMGLLTPAEGSVYVDGCSLADAHLPDYYRHLAYVPQEPPVFDGTLRENIVFDRSVSEESLASVLQDVCLDELVRNLPQGLDTPIGEKGAQLSGGERQRLAFARLFLQNDARILILDEATSALDTVTEQHIMNALLRRRNGRTVILIAHRLSTLRSADCIYLLKNGHMQAHGAYSALCSTSPYFAELIAAGEHSDGM